MLKTVLITGIVELLAVPVVVFLVKRAIAKRLDRFDEKREEARIERAENERRKIEQREAERDIILAIARTMLLNNWERCIEKGFYTVEEREVYHKLWVSYTRDGGNGIIEEIAPRIRALPMEPPKHHHEEHEEF
jgi:hypothetical protein